MDRLPRRSSRIPFMTAAWWMLLVTLISAADGAAPLSVEEALERYPPQTYRCLKTEGPIDIDGRADEEAWNRAAVIAPFWRLYTPAVAQLGGGTARLLWDQTYLYLAVHFRDRDLRAIHVVHDTTLWKDDVVEVFLKPLAASTQYYELHVNPLNTTLDLAYPGRNAGPWTDFITYESGMRTAVALQGSPNDTTDVDESWSIEIALPFAAIDAVGGKTPAEGDRWRFAVSRYNYSSRLPQEFKGVENSSSVRCMQDGFHTYEQFDYLHFTSEEP